MKVVIAIEFDGLSPEFLQSNDGEANSGYLVAMAALTEAKNHPELNARIAAGDVAVRFSPDLCFNVDPSEAVPPAEDPPVS